MEKENGPALDEDSDDDIPFVKKRPLKERMHPALVQQPQV